MSFWQTGGEWFNCTEGVAILSPLPRHTWSLYIGIPLYRDTRMCKGTPYIMASPDFACTLYNSLRLDLKASLAAGRLAAPGCWQESWLAKAILLLRKPLYNTMKVVHRYFFPSGMLSQSSFLVVLRRTIELSKGLVRFTSWAANRISHCASHKHKAHYCLIHFEVLHIV